MAERRRGETKNLKNDRRVRRDVLDEIVTETVQDHMAPKYQHPNRDQARGDWDRSGRHTDEEKSRNS